MLSAPNETYSSTIATWLSSSTTIRFRGWLITGESIDCCNKQQPDRLFDHHPARNVHDGAIFGKGRIQRRKAVAVLVQVTPQMLLHQAALGAQCLCQSRDLYAGGQRLGER